MTPTVNLKFSLSASLSIAGLCLVAILLGALWLYADALSQSQFQPSVPRPNWQETISSAQDLSTLKASCVAVAQSLTSNTSLVTMQSTLLKRISSIFGWLLVVLGGVGFIVMAVIHFQIRRVVKGNAL